MWPSASRARVARAVAADDRERARLRAARDAVRRRTRAAVASPAGLLTAFAAGAVVGPLVVGLARSLRTARDVQAALAAVGIRPRDVVAGLRAAYHFVAAPGGDDTTGAGHGGTSPPGSRPKAPPA